MNKCFTKTWPKYSAYLCLWGFNNHLKSWPTECKYVFTLLTCACGYFNKHVKAWPTKCKLELCALFYCYLVFSVLMFSVFALANMLPLVFRLLFPCFSIFYYHLLDFCSCNLWLVPPCIKSCFSLVLFSIYKRVSPYLQVFSLAILFLITLSTYKTYPSVF